MQKGRCFRLITRGTYDKLPAHSVPEILRVPLEKVVLQVKAMLGSDKSAVTAQGGAEGRAKTSTSSMVLLCRCPDVPSEASVQAAEQLLAQIQALNAETGLLTPLGRHLSTLPCMPRVGKLCIYGALLGCVYPATAVAACMTVRSPFLSSNDPDVQRRVKAAKVGLGCDRYQCLSKGVTGQCHLHTGSVLWRGDAAVGLHDAGERAAGVRQMPQQAQVGETAASARDCSQVHICLTPSLLLRTGVTGSAKTTVWRLSA